MQANKIAVFCRIISLFVLYPSFLIIMPSQLAFCRDPWSWSRASAFMATDVCVNSEVRLLYFCWFVFWPLLFGNHSIKLQLYISVAFSSTNLLLILCVIPTLMSSAKITVPKILLAPEPSDLLWGGAGGPGFDEDTYTHGRKIFILANHKSQETLKENQFNDF